MTELIVEHVMEVFKRITSVNTPSINSRLALPFKKRPVKDSSKFIKEYADIKDDLRKITGGLGKQNYQEKREKKKSLPFPWSAASQSEINLDKSEV